MLNAKISTGPFIVFLIILLISLAVQSSLLLVFYLLAGLLFLLYSILINNTIRFPKWLIPVVLFYIPFLVLGIAINDDFHIDFKFHLFTLFAVIIWQTVFKKLSIEILCKIFVAINGVIFLYYILLGTSIIPIRYNIYEPLVKAGGYGYRLSGPDLTTFTITPLLYLWGRKRFDKMLVYSSICGIICIILNGSFQHLAIFFIVSVLVLVKAKYIVSVPLILYLFFQLVLSASEPFVDKRYLDKLHYVSRPWEYPTFIYRLKALDIMIDQNTQSLEQIVFGSGVGVKATFFEKNELSPSLSRWRTFQEIDNGFFYVYHRFGLLGLFYFLALNFYPLIIKKTDIKFKLAVTVILLITNLLSIHYFTNSLFFICLIMAFNSGAISHHIKKVGKAN